jgi:hypothetical protein
VEVLFLLSGELGELAVGVLVVTQATQEPLTEAVEAVETKTAVVLAVLA